MQDYVRDGAEIYRRSFSIIRSEADLARFSKAEERVAVRLIHACGMVEVARDIVMSPGFADNARWALIAGAPVLCDSRMVANGITRARLPAANDVVCTLDDSRVPELARRIGNPAASRAVGLANGRNPIPIIIPCHRVIGSSGKLTGYGGGLPIKEHLLALEAPQGTLASES